MIKPGEIRWTHNRLIKVYVLCEGNNTDRKKYGVISYKYGSQNKIDFWQCLILEDNVSGTNELLGQIKFLYIGDICDDF